MDKETKISGFDTESIYEMSKNKTLFAEKLTLETPLKPQVVHNLPNVEAVFKYYQPTANLLFETEEGQSSSETIKFHAVEDFSVEAIVQKSSVLKTIVFQKETYFKLAHLIASDENLQHILNSAEEKQVLLQWLSQAINDLKNLK